MNRAPRASRRAAVALALSALAALYPVRALADDFHVDSDTSFQAYEVRSPGTATLLARRRLVQSLGLTWARRLTTPETDDDPTPRIAASLRLRLDHDFGDDCLVAYDLCVDATNENDAGAYQPIATDTLVDAPEAWVEVRELPAAARVRVGRHAVFAPEGILRLDGGTAIVAPTGWLEAETFGGALVRRTTLLGTGAFEPQGVLRLDLPDSVEPSRVPYVSEPTTTWAVGGALSLGEERIVRVRTGFRQLFEADGLVARQGSLSIASQPIEELRVSALSALDLVDGTLFDAVASVEVLPVPILTLRARVEHHVPRFDYASIWMYFDPVPITEGSAYGTLRITDDLELGIGARGRGARIDDATSETDASVEGHARARIQGFRVMLYGSSWGGDLGPVASVMLDVARKLAWWVEVDLRASVWHFDDPLRQDLDGTSVAEAAGVRFILSEPTALRLDFEHSYNDVVGHRFRFVAQLAVEVWR